MPDTARKGTWPRVAFGDVVRLSKERCSDPLGTGIERYVGLEHIEPNDLKIRRWGNVADGTTFTSAFHTGQVLFGKRRAYQRKVAVAGFSGVCSGDIYVLEPANDRLLPELLPFLCQTEDFFEHAVGTSAGSLSPRTNWKQLAVYEFALPPLKEQRRIVEALQGAHRQSLCLQQLCEATRVLYESTAVQLFSGHTDRGVKPSEWKPSAWNCAVLEELVVADAPICYGIVQVGDFDPDGVPTLAINNLSGDFDEGVHKTAPRIEMKYGRSRVSPNDILVSVKATIGEIAIVPPKFSGNISRDLARIRIRDAKVGRRFFYHLYRSPNYRRYIQTLVVGSTRAELSIAALRSAEVPFPSTEEQDRISDELNAIEACIAMAEERQEMARDLLRAATSQLLQHQE